MTFPDVGIYEFIFDRTLPVSKPALIDGFTGETITYGELKARVNRLAGGLHHYGIKPYDVVGIFSPNHVEYPIAVFAAHRLGATVTTANPTYTPDELNFQLGDAKPRILITVPELLDTARKAAKGTKVEKIFVFGAIGSADASPVRDLERSNVVPPAVAIKDAKTRTALLCYSSGTTGEEKPAAGGGGGFWIFNQEN